MAITVMTTTAEDTIYEKNKTHGGRKLIKDYR
jgi:hypothetical protein